MSQGHRVFMGYQPCKNKMVDAAAKNASLYKLKFSQ